MPHRIASVARPVIFAHRGVSAHAPENTLAAFRLAREHGADGIELDAKLTADGQVVVIHDQTTDRTTGVSGIVRKMSLKQLKALEAGSHFNPAFKGEPIPTLAEVFEAVGGQVLINVEITNYASATDALPNRIADLVNRYGLHDSVLFSSFHPLSLYRIHQRLPESPLAILTMAGMPGALLRGWLGRQFAPKFIHPYYTDVTQALMTAEHQQGRNVNVWTVNDPKEMKRLFNLQIDGIITDDPHLARCVLEEK